MFAGHRDAPQRPGAATRDDLGVAEHGAAEAQHVAIGQVGDGDGAAVDVGAVGAAVVEDARALAAEGEDRVAARNV